MNGRLRAVGIAAPISLLVLWELAVRTNVLDARLFPAPSAIAGNFADYVRSGQLGVNGVATLSRLVVGLLLGGIPGTLLGLAMGMNHWVRAYFGPVIALLYPIPKIAILPLFYFLFGTGEAAKWAAVAVGVFFLMAINTEAGVRQIERIYLDVARAYRIRPGSFFFRVLLPGALPNIYAGLKLSIGIGIVLAIAAEYQLTRSGLGFVLATVVDWLESVAMPWRSQRRA
ncbi:MAG: ABC transporter permease [Candidatus Eremiobacteraeota bacterium]|nr:ABC transporter permease [Candidatus Eremiobacteraeota bacterium]